MAEPRRWTAAELVRVLGPAPVETHPCPWEAARGDHTDNLIVDANGRRVADCVTGTAARVIVQAVNELYRASSEPAPGPTDRTK